MGPWLLLLFIVGDILGTGIYALTGHVAKQVGGVVWLPFLVAFVVALLTAFSYLELVTKYPRAAGAALYTHKAFGIHFVTFIVAFAVMCSGITSASTASRAFAANFAHAFNLPLAGTIAITAIGLLFMAAVAVDQLPRRRREREGECRPHLRRAHGPLDHHHDRHVGDRARARRRVARHGIQDRGRRQRILAGDRGDHAGLLRHGGVRGFRQHGGGMQGPVPPLPEGAARRTADHRR